MRLCIRADGGPDIGYGHLVRSGAGAERAIERGNEVVYATTTPDRVREVCPSAVETTTLPDRGDPGPFVKWVNEERPDVVFTDAYPVGTEYQRAVREQVPLAVYQDDARHAVCAEALVNGNLHAGDLDYEFVGTSPRTRLGTNFVPLRRRISELAAREPPERTNPERALVTMGGSDVANVTPLAVRAFDGTGLRVDAIVGPGFSPDQERAIIEAAANVSTDVTVVRDPDDLPERMFQADFAVSTASSTTYELLALGTPLISHPAVANQEPIATALRDHELATVLNRGADISGFSRAVAEYVSSPETLGCRRTRGRTLVDGRGADRICTELLSLTPEDQGT